MTSATHRPLMAPVSLPWAVLALGLIVLYGPSFYQLANGLWTTERQSHGPIVLGLALWFFWFKVKALAQAPAIAPQRQAANPVAGSLVLGVGLMLFVLGRSQGVLFLEIGSLVPVLLGTALLCCGLWVVKPLWFAFFFLLFLVPLPASLVDAVTQPLKLAVSMGAEQVLAGLGYPVARAGVMLQLGPYQLMVADACAGMNSLFTLEALGLLYMNYQRQTSVPRNALLATLIVPISYASNVVRVLTLALITFHWGDEAGQGFLHGFSGLLLFMTALFLIVGIDALLRHLFPDAPPQAAPA